MKLLSIFCILAASIPLAEPLNIRDNPAKNSSLIDSAGSSALPELLVEDNFTPAPIKPETDDPMALIPTSELPAETEPTELPPGSEPTELSTRANPNRKLKWNFTWNLPAAKVVAKALIELNSSGWVRFQTVFENSGPWTRKAAIACAIRDRTGRPYTLQRISKVYGWVSIFQDNSELVDESREHADVSTYWWDIEKGDKKMECHVEIKNYFSLESLNDLVKGVIGTLKSWGPVNGPSIVLF